MNEILRLEQAEQIQNFIRSKQLTVFSFSSDEIDEVVNDYKEQAKRLSERIESYIGEHPYFTIKRIMLSGFN